MRKILPFVLSGLLFHATVFAEKIPVEAFANPGAFTNMTLSRSGKYVAYKAEYENAERVFMRNLETEDIIGVEPPSWATNRYGRIGGMLWLSGDRLLVNTYLGYIAIDGDGENYEILTGGARKLDSSRGQRDLIYGGRIIHAPRDQKSDFVLMEQFDTANRKERVGYFALRNPNIIRINTKSGHFMPYELNPGEVNGWISDRDGNIRIATKIKGLKSYVYHRKNEKDSWKELKGLGNDPLDASPLGLSADGEQLYISKLSEAKRYAIYTFDIEKDQIGEAIIEHALYDINPSNRGGPISAPDGRLLGIRYYTDKAHTYWLESDYAVIQQQIDNAVPNSVNRILSISDDEQRLLVFASTSQNPGTYYLFDRTENSLAKFVDVMPWIDPSKMAKKRPFKIKARDGLVLHGYFTAPLGKKMKNLPMVVMVHGGPWARDMDGFDPQVQFLANRGYGVLQINYRGSTGYGAEFYKKGFHQVGTGMQDDIEDATRWAIKSGIADPQRIAIMGGSFGGYSTLMGLIRSPELYACGISIAGVTDWEGVLEHGQALVPTQIAFNIDRIGDPESEALKAISPVYHVDKIQDPLLIVHGRDDPVVPYNQAKKLTAALDKAGKSYELIAEFNEQHGIANYKNRIELYNSVEAFLTKHMPAGD